MNERLLKYLVLLTEREPNIGFSFSYAKFTTYIMKKNIKEEFL